jgi:hypothetical protein
MDGFEQEHFCSLCSFTFRGSECHSGCPFAQGCRMVRCPRCSYEFVDESTVVNWFKRMFRTAGKQNDGRAEESTIHADSPAH